MVLVFSIILFIAALVNAGDNGEDGLEEERVDWEGWSGKTERGALLRAPPKHAWALVE